MVNYFGCLSEQEAADTFFSPPLSDIRTLEREALQYALGATLYMPACRPTAASDILALRAKGLMSAVLCLEDAVGDKEVNIAENLLTNHFLNIKSAVAVRDGTAALPLLFVRVRNAEQMHRVANNLGDNLSLLSGFVFPKFTKENGELYLSGLGQINRDYAKNLYGMPILETADIMNEDTRIDALMAIKKILDRNRHLILNVRIGATDFSGLFGLRRSYDMSVYDILPVRDCISSIINVFMREDSDYIISGPVWEFFSSSGRILKSQLGRAPFAEEFGSFGYKLRNNLVCRYIDGLIKEVLLDKANGLVGKTIIHPSHIKPVQALSVVTYEEYCDARSILANSDGEKGVIKSTYENKMNEIKPHSRWARKIMAKAKIYGVFNEEHNFTRLLFTNTEI